MKKRYVIPIVSVFAIIAGIIGLRAGYARTRKNADIAAEANYRSISNSSQPDVTANNDYSGEYADSQQRIEIMAVERINSVTKMVYEYYYEEDGRTEETVQYPHYSIIGLSVDELEHLMEGWQIIEFSPDEVVMRKTIQGRSGQYYIVGVQNGYVAVFYENEINGTNLKEVTDTPVNALPFEEQQKLTEGIYVDGFDKLVRILEDIGS